MKSKLIQSIAVIALVVLAGFISAPTSAFARTSPLVSTQWMEKNLGASNIVLIDVRTESNYGVGHLPGAVSMPYTEWNHFNEDEDCQLMPTPADFSKKMQAFGVSTKTHVIIYDHGNTTGDATKGTSSLWVMEAMGHDNVSYLDGGFTKWTFEGRILDNVKPTPEAGNFTAKVDNAKVATLDEVIATVKAKKAVFVDARSADDHFGVKKRADVERFGHIPGSISLPATFLNNAGVNRAPAVLMSKKQLKTMIKGVGLPTDKNKELIIYCNSGQYAGLDYFVLHDLLGYKNVSLYDGSILQYAADEDLPLVRFAWGHISQ